MRRIVLAAVAVLALAAPAAAPAAAGPALTVDVTGAAHAISPYIYGLNFADAADAARLGLPVDRWGGNTTDTYNYRTGSYNTGNDYYFENIPDCWDAAFNWCGGGAGPARFAYRDFVAKDRAAGADSLITLPLMGYVARDGRLNHPFTCGFPRTRLPLQDSFDPYDTNCGNGLTGGVRQPSVPTRTGRRINVPAYGRGFVRDLIGRYGKAAAGGVKLYELGNEPALWADTHRDMHPQPEDAIELVTNSIDTADQVKRADAGAAVLGFSEWGWPAYFCSGADTPGSGCDDLGCTTSPDCAGHGHMPMVEWFLQRFQAHDAATGTRHLDYLDVHYYAQGGSTTDVTRSLWDPTYTDPSWIGGLRPGGVQIRLLGRMQGWIDARYPGTRRALSEYNLSVAGPAVNALIQADTLGIFAREGVDLATRWPMGNDGGLITSAFAMYRNYDGAHHAFGTTYEPSASADQAKVAVYGARRADGTQTAMVINKTAGALTSPLTFSHLGASAAAAQRWDWNNATGAITRGADQTLTAGGFSAALPARSITLFVLPPA